MDWRMDDWSLSSRVSPFRDPWIKGYLLLPMAFRSLSRLSSALSAKASALCSFLLDLRYIALYRFLIITVWFPIRFSVCFSDVWFLWKSFLKIILCMKFSRYCYEHLDGNKCNAVSILRAIRAWPLVRTSFLRSSNLVDRYCSFWLFYQPSENKIPFILWSLVNTSFYVISFLLFFSAPAATCFPMPSPA